MQKMKKKTKKNRKGAKKIHTIKKCFALAQNIFYKYFTHFIFSFSLDFFFDVLDAFLSHEIFCNIFLHFTRYFKFEKCIFVSSVIYKIYLAYI